MRDGDLDFIVTNFIEIESLSGVFFFFLRIKVNAHIREIKLRKLDWYILE